MPPVCTCGASLSDDAVFCHRCGKPQREPQIEPQREIPVAVAPRPAAATAASVSRVSFGSPLAVRTSLLVASFTSILEFIPFLGLIAPVIGGFVTVSLFQRRSGLKISRGEGAKLGWLTAVFNAILLTIVATVAASQGGFNLNAVQDQMKKQGMAADQLQMLNSPWFLPFAVLLAWLMLFALSSLLHIAGGALGSRAARNR